MSSEAAWIDSCKRTFGAFLVLLSGAELTFGKNGKMAKRKG
jgi:hypothetical protein